MIISKISIRLLALETLRLLRLAGFLMKVVPMPMTPIPQTLERVAQEIPTATEPEAKEHWVVYVLDH